MVMYLTVSKRSILNSILLAISCYCAFIIRPVFLIFPFILFAYFVIHNKKDILFSALFILLFSAFLIPFGVWNKVNHGVFKITTIDGAAGAMQMGYWALKLPDGYTEPFYWGHNMAYDLTRPRFYTKEQEQENIKQYKNEWAMILDSVKKFQTSEDSAYLMEMKKNPNIFPIHNSRYTIEREKLIMKVTLKNVFNDPVYTIKSKMYEFLRFYITGINYNRMYKPDTIFGKIRIFYPMFVTFVFIFCALIYCTGLFLLKRLKFNHSAAFIILFWYYGIIHLPFSIQARYTIPIHMLILSFLSIALLNNSRKSG